MLGAHTDPIVFNRGKIAELEKNSSIRLYRFFCILSLSGYYIWTRHHVNNLFKDSNSWLMRGCEAIEAERIDKVADSDSHSLEILCDELFEVAEDVKHGGIAGSSPHKILLENIDLNFIKGFYRGFAAREILTQDSIKQLLSSQSGVYLKLKQGVGENGKLLSIFFAKAAQLARIRQRNRAFAEDMRNNKKTIMGSRAVKKCFDKFLERLNKAIESYPLGLVLAKFNYLDVDSPFSLIAKDLFPQFCNFIAHSDFATLEELLSFFLQPLAAENLDGLDNFRQLAERLHLCEKNNWAANAPLTNRYVKPAVDRLGELVGEFRRDLQRCLLTETLEFKDGSATTLRERFTAQSAQAEVPTEALTAEPAAVSKQKDALEEFCDKFFEPFASPLRMQVWDRSKGCNVEIAYASPWELLRAHFSEKLDGKDYILFQKLSRGESLEALLDSTCRLDSGNPLKLKASISKNLASSEWSTFLEIAPKWSKVALYENELNRIRREANHKIASELAHGGDSIRAAVEGHAQALFEDFSKELAKPPLNSFFAIDNGTQNFLPGKMFNFFSPEYMSSLECSRDDPTEAPFKFFPPPIGNGLTAHGTTLREVAAAMHLKLKKSALGSMSICSHDATSDVIEAMNCLNLLINNFRIDLWERIEGDETIRVLIASVVAQELDKSGRGGTSLGVRLAEAQSKYEEALRDFEAAL
jgi:hypothetical protein